MAAPLRGREPRWIKPVLLLAVALFLGAFLLLPLGLVLVQGLSLGGRAAWAAVSQPNALAALRLSLLIAGVVVPVNTLLGLAAAWTFTRFDFAGKTLLLTLLDLPLAASPVLVGLMAVLLFGPQGWWGPWLGAHGMQVLNAPPAILLVTLFVTAPYVARQLIPLMRAQGSEQEQAALVLGAGPWTIFWRVTLPNIRGGLLNGILLCGARAVGEFGAVSVVSGRIPGRTETLPLRVDSLLRGGQSAAAFGVASVLALLALLGMGLKAWLRWRWRKAAPAERGAA